MKLDRLAKHLHRLNKRLADQVDRDVETAGDFPFDAVTPNLLGGVLSNPPGLSLAHDARTGNHSQSAERSPTAAQTMT
ncbi:MAG: hypothetical protein O2960_04750 [Verrucomicrobia bacterium]|nr:hypothetical protein [Verrucomicrobiota bacterium]